MTRYWRVVFTDSTTDVCTADDAEHATDIMASRTREFLTSPEEISEQTYYGDRDDSLR